MKQREIYLADLNPVKGREQKGVRPVVVISGDSMNEHLGIAIVCAITSALKNYASSVFLKKNKENGLKEDSEIITFQIRTVDKARLIKKMGEISELQLQETFSKLGDVLKY